MFRKMYYWIFKLFRKEIQVRKVRNGDYIFLERRGYLFFGLIEVPFVTWKWKPLNNKYLKIHQDLNKTSDKLKKLINDYKETVFLIQREKEELGNRLEGDWLPYTLDKGETLKCEGLIDQPTDSWKKIVNPKLAKMKDRFVGEDGILDVSDIRSNTRESTNAPEYFELKEDMPKSSRTVYYPEEAKAHSLMLQDIEEADTGMAFRKPQEKKNDQNSRKKMPGESDEAHKARIAALNAAAKAAKED